MPYLKVPSRSNPTAFVFLVDQSGSMSEQLGDGSGRTKAQFVADAVNSQLMELVLRCTQGSNVRNYFHVAVIGYGKEVGPILGGHLSGRDLLPIEEIANNPLRIEDFKQVFDNGEEETTSTPVWLDPQFGGATPMCRALDYAAALLQQHVASYPDCFPPTIINITDGQSTDGDPSQRATDIRSLNTSDGEVLFYNVHVSSTAGELVVFPDTTDDLPDVYARLLFSMSSLLPHVGLVRAGELGFAVSDASRGFMYNADPTALMHMLDIGTSTRHAAAEPV